MSDSTVPHTSESPSRPDARAQTGPGAGARRFGYLVAIIVNLVLIYLANGVPNWDVPVITNDWPDVLWAVNLSLGASVVANLAFLAYDPAWFRHAAQIGLNAISLVVLYTLRRVFPFDLSPSLEQVLRLALLVGMFGVGIAIIVDFVHLVLGRDR